MRPALLTLMLCLPAPAAADAWCEHLWITRNAFFHRAGHCFGSVLGQELFGNAGCKGNAPALAPDDAEAVAHLRWMEGEHGCRVATNRAPSSRMRAEAARIAALRDIPVADIHGWACHGYRGPGIALRSGASDDAPVTGQVTAGQTMGSEHQFRGDWMFATVSSGPGTPRLAEGWTRQRVQPGECEQEAG
ncbi:MAG TPA: DUF4453 domain-containing protein [Paracoccaceae bacterium]|nr:DUF4453 domain-containing protein [Paracoccaceae bacterium]HMO73566.1 DUF4453 domain-containing protein [Paracoccaceae bacterium]